jgi:hypothetical protein
LEIVVVLMFNLTKTTRIAQRCQTPVGMSASLLFFQLQLAHPVDLFFQFLLHGWI